jgi:hypothetical protein
VLDISIGVACVFATPDLAIEGVSANVVSRLESDGWSLDDAFNSTYANGSRVFEYVLQSDTVALSALTNNGGVVQIRAGVADFYRMSDYKETIVDVPGVYV